MSIEKTLQVGLILFLGVTLMLFGVFYAGPVVEGTEGTRFEQPVITEFILNLGYGLFFLAAIISIVAGLVNIFSEKRKAIKALIVLGAFAVIVIISYFLSSDQVLHMPAYRGSGNEPGTIKWVGTGLIVTYILIASAIVSTFTSWIFKMRR